MIQASIDQFGLLPHHSIGAYLHDRHQRLWLCKATILVEEKASTSEGFALNWRMDIFIKLRAASLNS